MKRLKLPGDFLPRLNITNNRALNTQAWNTYLTKNAYGCGDRAIYNCVYVCVCVCVISQKDRVVYFSSCTAEYF